MAIINKGTAFSNGEQLSASKLNNLLDGATFGTDSVDNSSTLLNSSGAITVRDSGITTAKLATDAVETAKIKDANVTFAKLTDVIDDDTMDTATDTTLATSESIKAYVDNGSIVQTSGSAPYYGCRAFGVFDGTGSSPFTPQSSGNVESITRISNGYFEVTLTTPMVDANYSIVVTGNHHATVSYASNENVANREAGKFTIYFGSSSSLYNPDYISFAVFA